MKHFSTFQRDLLIAALATPERAVTIPTGVRVSNGGAAVAALVRHGLVRVAQADDGRRLLQVTEEGARAALQTVEPPRARERRPRLWGRQKAAGLAVLGDRFCEEDEPWVNPNVRGKSARMVEMLKRPEGATLEELMELTGWQRHSVQGAIHGAFKKKLGLNIQRIGARGEARYVISYPENTPSDDCGDKAAARDF